jgi:hypothetical protein
MRLIVIAATALTIAWFCHPGTAQPPPKRTEQQTARIMLLNERLAELMLPDADGWSAYVAWEEDRNYYSLRLIEMANPESAEPVDDDTRELAVRLLGTLGCRNGIPTLVKYLDWKHARDPTGHPGSLEAYPCAIALAQIGQTGVPQMLRILAQTGRNEVTAEMIDLRVELLLAIYGHEEVGAKGEGGPEEAIAVIERSAKRRQPGERENLVRLADALRVWLAEFRKGGLKVEAE